MASLYLKAPPVGEIKVEPAVSPLGRALVLEPMSAPKMNPVGVESVMAVAV